MKFVDFETYCEKCLYFEKNECEDPCNTCLNEPVRDNSEKPIEFKKNTKRRKRNGKSEQRL